MRPGAPQPRRHHRLEPNLPNGPVNTLVTQEDDRFGAGGEFTTWDDYTAGHYVWTTAAGPASVDSEFGRWMSDFTVTVTDQATGQTASIDLTISVEPAP